MFYKLDEKGYISAYSFDTVLTGGGVYDKAVPERFSEENFFAWRFEEGELVFDPQYLEETFLLQKEEKELEQLTEWFAWYDRKIMEYGRCARLGQEWDQDIDLLDRQAAEKQQRIRKIRERRGSC